MKRNLFDDDDTEEVALGKPIILTHPVQTMFQVEMITATMLLPNSSKSSMSTESPLMTMVDTRISKSSSINLMIMLLR